MSARIDMLGIFVTDMRQMVSFYRDVLGFKCNWQEGPYAEFENDGVRFSFYKRKRLPKILAHPVTFPNGVNGTFEIALEMPHPEDVDKEHRRIVASGALEVQPPTDWPWNMRSSTVADPDGNLIEISSRNIGTNS